jgi:hypothetical protein
LQHFYTQELTFALEPPEHYARRVGSTDNLL